MPEMSKEMTGQILQDILADNQKIAQHIQHMQQKGGVNFGSQDIAVVDWFDLETLDYIASQLVKKIKYLRGDRY